MAFLILIEGGTSSGKSTLAHELFKFLIDDFSVVLIHQDDYYKDLSHFSQDELINYNFDNPDAIDLIAFSKDIQALQAGSCIRERKYDFINHKNYNYE